MTLLAHRGPLVLSLFAAAGLHGAALAMALDVIQRPGAAPRETLSVSLNLVETVVIEQSAQDKSVEDAGLDMPAAASAPSEPAPQAQSEATETAPSELTAEQEPSHPPAETALARTEPDATGSIEPIPAGQTPATLATPPVTPKVEKPASDNARQEAAEPARPAAEPKKLERKPKPKAKKKAVKPTKRKSAPSSPSRAKKKKSSRQARLSASPGQVRSYAAMVRARVARKRPRGGARAGTAVIAFAVSASGRLRYARVSRSSGNKTLDGAALRSVRSAAPFPAPPKAMTARQLSFVIPFHFR